MAGILKIAYGHLQILLFLLKNCFCEKLILVQKRVLPNFLSPPLPLSVTLFVLYAFPANPSLRIRGIS